MHTIVIGGGISGLACAVRLQQLGIPVLLFEQSSRVGGVIASVTQDGFLFELGPQSFLSTDLLLELIEAVGLGPELLRSDPRAARYVLAGGRLHRVPISPPALLATSLVGLGTKWRLLTEPLRKSQPPAQDESVAAFVRRKFGNDLLEMLVGPFVSGVYAGDPEKLSLRSAFPSAYRWEKEFGSVIRGAMKSRPAKGKPRPALCSFRGGVEALIRALGEKLGNSIHCGVGATVMRRGKANGKSTFELTVSSQGRTEALTASAVVVATDTLSAGRLLTGISPQFAEHLARIEYAPVAVVAAGYRREQVGHPLGGFGFLVPRKEGLKVLGTVWNSSLFPGRAPEGKVALTSFAGGATDPQLVNSSEEEIAEIVLHELAGVLTIAGRPVAQQVAHHSRALPQYNLGHGRTVAALRELCATTPGLFLAGNYLEGPAIGVCVEQAFAAAQAVTQYLTTSGEFGRTDDAAHPAAQASR